MREIITAVLLFFGGALACAEVNLHFVVSTKEKLCMSDYFVVTDDSSTWEMVCGTSQTITIGGMDGMSDIGAVAAMVDSNDVLNL